MIYRVLGPLVIGPEGSPLRLPTGHTLKVLAGLLLRANHPVSTTELIIGAWGHSNVQTGQLHKAISAVRDLLRQVGREDDLITRRSLGYEIHVESPTDLDALLFKDLVVRAERAKTRRQTGEEIGYLWQAVGLWRGEHPISNTPDHGWETVAHDLDQRRRRAVARLCDLEFGRGSYDAILDQLSQLTACHPVDERLHEQRIIALYRTGSAAEAVRVFERYRSVLERQTGAKPSPALRNLAYAASSNNEQIIAAAEATIAARTGDSGAGTVAVPRQLPPAPADVLGRDDLVAEMNWLLDRPRSATPPILVIWGAGGSGKTALMVHVAHLVAEDYPDGHLYAELRATAGAAAETDEVLAAFLRAFDVARIPESRAERLAAFRTLTAGRRVLVLLDNAPDEHHIRDLIPANPACAVLVATRRRRLPDLDGAHHLPPLRALTTSEGIDLFQRIVARSGIDVSAEMPAVERVVTLGAGLPLALRIAANQRVRDHPRSTADLADRLAKQGLQALEYGPRSVALTIGAGFERLNSHAQHLFLGLAVTGLPEFGHWTAVALLAGSDADPVEALSHLAGYTMVESDATGQRYRFHDLTREYAEHMAAQRYSTNERLALAERVYSTLLTLTRLAHRRLVGGDFEVVHADISDQPAPPSVAADIEASARDWFELERLNIRAAVERCADLGLSEVAWDLAFSSHEFYTHGGYFDDWHTTHTAALRACRTAGDRHGEAVMLIGLGQPALVASRHSGGLPSPADLAHAVDILHDSGDEHGQAIAERTLANALRRGGQLARPLELFLLALARYEASGDAVGRWQTLRYIGQTYLDRHEPDEALRELNQALTAASALSSVRAIAQTRYWMGHARLAVGDLNGAHLDFTAVLEAFPEPVGSGHAYALHGLGDLALRTGDLPSAQARLAQAAQLARDAFDGTLEGRVMLSTAQLCRRQADLPTEVSALEAAAECFAGVNAPYHQAVALAALRNAELRRGNAAAAKAAAERYRVVLATMDLPPEDGKHLSAAVQD